jgi:hypothetical protein
MAGSGKLRYPSVSVTSGRLQVRKFTGSMAVLTAALLAAGCTPTVKIATDEPITINLNVNIKHEILVKVDKELDNLFDEDSELF